MIKYKIYAYILHIHNKDYINEKFKYDKQNLKI